MVHQPKQLVCADAVSLRILLMFYDPSFRSVRNFVIDVRKVPPGNTGTGIHWQVAQGTSLMNIVFYMSSEKGTAHQGIWMENGRYWNMFDP